MILRYLIAFGVSLVALGGGPLVQAWARRYAARRPQFGPAHEDGLGGCIGHCAGANKTSCTSANNGDRGMRQ